MAIRAPDGANKAMTDRKHEMIVNLSDIALKSKEADTFI